MKRAQAWRHAIALIAECWTLAEIGYYYTHDGETLHGAIAELCDKLAERLSYRASVRKTLHMIYDLPEWEGQ